MSRQCICSWPECRKWAEQLEKNKAYSNLGKTVRLKFELITKLEQVVKDETDPKKKEKAIESLELQSKFRRLVLRHLKPPQQSALKNKDLIVARLHFPHEYISTRKHKLYKPVSSETALQLGVGILPMDSLNVASRSTNTYFVPPVVSKNYMKSFMGDLIETDEPHETVSSRTSRMLGRKNIRNINEEESIVRNVTPMQKPKSLPLSLIIRKCGPEMPIRHKDISRV